MGIVTTGFASELFGIITLSDWFVRVIIYQYISFFIFWRFLGGGLQIIICGLTVNTVLSMIFILCHKPLREFNDYGCLRLD